MRNPTGTLRKFPIQMRRLSGENPPFRISFSRQQSKLASHRDNRHGSDNNRMFPLPVGLGIIPNLTDNRSAYNWRDANTPNPSSKLKIKCVHEGSPPCQNCAKKGRTRSGECHLTGPELKRKRMPEYVKRI